MVLCCCLPLVHCGRGLPQHLQATGEFSNLAIYEVSYMWYSAVACLWCSVVGVIVSIYKPQVTRNKLSKRENHVSYSNYAAE